MSDQMITSRDNALVKRARSIRDGKIHDQIFIEGLRLAEEAQQALSVEGIKDALYTERIAQDERGSNLLEKLKRDGLRTTLVSESVFASISSMKTPQGIVLLASRPRTVRGELLRNLNETPLIVVMHRINNPSNAGAILRTAEAAEASGAILTEGTTNIFSPKALRGAMGSSFRLPLWTGASFDEALSFCQKHSIRTISTDLKAERTHTEIGWTQPSAFIVGEEATGLNSNEIAAADASVRIPMRATVESLNVAVAAGVILYEAARQRAAGGR
jgi:TrmH family RNA methyltransferase